MKRWIVGLAAVVVLVGVGQVGVANAAVVTLDFEDLSGSGALPTDYAGLTWDSHWQYYDWPQPPYNPSSGVERIYTHNYGGWIAFGTDVTFLGSWVATNDAGQETYWEGYDDGVKKYESSHLLGGVQDWISVSWSGVDYVNLVSTHYDYFIVDDVRYDDYVIPEPSALIIWSLLGALGITVGWWRRRRRKAA